MAVVGGGIAGCAAAYYLARAGASVTLMERAGPAAGASGLSAGGLNPLEGEHIPGPLARLAMWSYRLHLDLWDELAELTGADLSGRMVPWLRIALDEDDLPDVRRSLSAFSGARGFSGRLLDPTEVMEMEPRISPGVLCGALLWGNAAVDGRALTAALMTAAGRMGARFVRAAARVRVRGSDGSVEVGAGSQRLSAGAVIVAAGPWSAGVIGPSGVDLPIRPVKGEILRIDPPGPAYRLDIAYPGGEAHPKPDGLVWIGATVEEAGFDAEPSPSARRSLMADAARAVPDLARGAVAMHTACLRPVARDGLPVIGPAAGRDDLLVASGGGKKGVLLGPAMGKAAADTAIRGWTDVPVEGLGPGRFD